MKTNEASFTWLRDAIAKADEAVALVNRMVEWFLANYEDPVNSTPWESAEGGYQYLCGGPYHAREELTDQFSDAPRHAFSPLTNLKRSWTLRSTGSSAVISTATGAGEGNAANGQKSGHNDVPLLRAYAHQWGRGHVHRLLSGT
jgi:hypothetical protein